MLYEVILRLQTITRLRVSPANCRFNVTRHCAPWLEIVSMLLLLPGVHRHRSPRAVPAGSYRAADSRFLAPCRAAGAQFMLQMLSSIHRAELWRAMAATVRATAKKSGPHENECIWCLQSIMHSSSWESLFLAIALMVAA